MRGGKLVVKRGRCEKQPLVVKRRKIDNVDAYDPYREADPFLMEFVEKFVDSFDGGELVRLVDEEVKAEQLQKIAKDGCLSTNVLNTVLSQIYRRILAYPDSFEEGAGILDTYITHFLGVEHRKIVNSKDLKKLQFSRPLLNYVTGETPALSKPWAEVKYLYVPVFERDHFFLLRIDLKARKIYVYDSLPGHVIKSVFDKWVVPFRVVIPLVLRNCVEGYEDYSLDLLEVEKVVGLPVQDNGTDCGMFVLKFVEFLTGKLDVGCMQVDKMPY